VSPERRISEDVDAEARFQASFENAFVGIAHVGLDGRWLRTNQTLCDIVGYTIDELQALTFQDITHADDLDADLDLLQALAERRIDHYRMEKRYLHKDGHTVWVDLQVAPQYDDEDALMYYISTVLDISEPKRLEEQLRQATRDSEHFATIIAHELQNPLNAISMHAELIQALGDPENSPIPIADSATTIIEQTRATADFINNMREVSRATNSDGMLRTVSLTDVVEHVRDSCGMRLQQSGASLKASGVLPDVLANEALTRHVFQNLIDNAIKYRRPDVPCEIVIEATSDSDLVTVVVSDNGQGIPEIEQASIFEHAQRGSNTGAIKGDGLGLALCWKSMSVMRGSIIVTSSVVGEGSAFLLTFKAAD